MRVTHKKYSEAPAPDDDSLIGGPDWNEEHQILGPYIAGVVQFNQWGSLLLVGGAKGRSLGDGRFVVELDSGDPISENSNVVTVSVTGERLYTHRFFGEIDEFTGNPVVQILEWSAEEGWIPTSDFLSVTITVICGVESGLN